jgi:hypothetical protein
MCPSWFAGFISGFLGNSRSQNVACQGLGGCSSRNATRASSALITRAVPSPMPGNRSIWSATAHSWWGVLISRSAAPSRWIWATIGLQSALCRFGNEGACAVPGPCRRERTALSVADACEAQVGDRSHMAKCGAEPMAIPGQLMRSIKAVQGMTRTIFSTRAKIRPESTRSLAVPPESSA